MSIILEQDFGTKGHKFNVKLLSNPTARVDLVDGTKQPLETVTKLTRGYSGEYSNLTPLEEEMDKAIDDLNNTKLKTPFEMAYFVFLIRCDKIFHSSTGQNSSSFLCSRINEIFGA